MCLFFQLQFKWITILPLPYKQISFQRDGIKQYSFKHSPHSCAFSSCFFWITSLYVRVPIYIYICGLSLLFQFFLKGNSSLKDKSHKTSTCPGHATTTQSMLVKYGKVGTKKYAIYTGCFLSNTPFQLLDLGHSDQISSYLQ